MAVCCVPCLQGCDYTDDADAGRVYEYRVTAVTAWGEPDCSERRRAVSSARPLNGWSSDGLIDTIQALKMIGSSDGLVDVQHMLSKVGSSDGLIDAIHALNDWF